MTTPWWHHDDTMTTPWRHHDNTMTTPWRHHDTVRKCSCSACDDWQESRDYSCSAWDDDGQVHKQEVHKPYENLTWGEKVHKHRRVRKGREGEGMVRKGKKEEEGRGRKKRKEEYRRGWKSKEGEELWFISCVAPFFKTTFVNLRPVLAASFRMWLVFKKLANWIISPVFT